MQKVEAQRSQAQNRPNQRRGGGTALESPRSEQIAQFEAMVENSPQFGKSAQFAATLNNSPLATAQRAMRNAIHNGPRMVAQRRSVNLPAAIYAGQPLDALPGEMVQRETTIHLGPGYEKRPHEAWNGVQQAQGHAKPLTQTKRAWIDGPEVLQRAINPVDIGALTDKEQIQALIERYNENYSQDDLNRLVRIVEAYRPEEGEKAALRNLIVELNKEVGNRDVVTHRVNLPRNVNDAEDFETMKTNCALTSVGALLGGTAGDVSEDLGQDRSEQSSDSFTSVTGDDALSKQINGMVDYVDGVFRRMGYSTNIAGRSKNYELIPAEQGVAAMKQYPTGTKFLVYMSKTENTVSVDEDVQVLGRPIGSHWVFADRYGSQVFFYDYQVDRVQKEIERQGVRDLRHGGGASSAVGSGSNSPTEERQQRGGGLNFSDLAAALEKLNQEDSEPENDQTSEPEIEQDDDLEMPEATMAGRIPLYEQGEITFSDYQEMFFIAVVPYIEDRQKLLTKLQSIV